MLLYRGTCSDPVLPLPVLPLLVPWSVTRFVMYIGVWEAAQANERHSRARFDATGLRWPANYLVAKVPPPLTRTSRPQ
jgi:hypothetical protein